GSGPRAFRGRSASPVARRSRPRWWAGAYAYVLPDFRLTLAHSAAQQTCPFWRGISLVTVAQQRRRTNARQTARLHRRRPDGPTYGEPLARSGLRADDLRHQRDCNAAAGAARRQARKIPGRCRLAVRDRAGEPAD